MTAAGLGIGVLGPMTLATSPPGGNQQQVPTTSLDFQLHGTQPNLDTEEFQPFSPAYACSFCHADYGLEIAPYDTWVVRKWARSWFLPGIEPE